jgi:hypothetical protein
MEYVGNQQNTDVHNLNIRLKYDFHMPMREKYYYTDIKLFNNLPPTIKSWNHDTKKHSSLYNT